MPSKYCKESNIVLRFPEERQRLVRRPLGDVYVDDTLDAMILRIKDIWSRGLYVASVGDRVTYSLLEKGVVPDIGIIDRQEKRGEAPIIDESLFNTVLTGVNRQGTVNLGLCRVIEEALEKRPTLIIIDGEEDLVGFPVVLTLPTGSAFIYGQPNVGAVFVEITEAVKNHARELLESLESI